MRVKYRIYAEVLGHNRMEASGWNCFIFSGGNLVKFLWGGGWSAEGTRLLGGFGGMLPQKIFKDWIPEMAFAAF